MIRKFAAIMLCLMVTMSYMVTGPVYADVGPAADNADVTYDKNGGVLNSLGIDTTEMPEDYDADSTDNPYGSDVMNMNPVSELYLVYTDYASETGNKMAELHGDGAKLDGKYSTMEEYKKVDLPFLDMFSLNSMANCDLKGTGRDQSIAVVYTDYRYNESIQPADCGIYLNVFDAHDPDNHRFSEPVKISEFDSSCSIRDSYLVQSQLQVTCGDYDHDSVDEIAVYVPAASPDEKPVVSVYDLINGMDSTDPYSAGAWQQTWNYILPSMNKEIIPNQADPSEYLKNFYNNVDLTSGDADNDGTDDLIISYGTTNVAYFNDPDNSCCIDHSLESRSVLLYGSGKGQMLKKKQDLSYGDDPLIRVSFAYGDLDDDGNEELIMGGQLQSEQSANISRVLGKYIYDQNQGKMMPEAIQNMYVVDGNDQDGTFSSANGWDQYYYSAPAMKTNIAVGKFFGDQSAERIYMDSVLYSYDSSFNIEDELEDTSTETDQEGNTSPKGSQVFIDWNEYYEFGAQAANYTGGAYDYAAICRVEECIPDKESHSAPALLSAKTDDDKETPDKVTELLDCNPVKVIDRYTGSEFFIASPDTDIDGTVAEYTGNHEITYTDPKVMAVLVSAPYFKDVAAIDTTGMLGKCITAFGTSKGETSGYQHSMSFEAGIVAGIEVGAFWMSGSVGFRMSSSWGTNTTKNFVVTYDSGGGEDSVVLYSVPSENFEYKIKGVTVDDEGNITEYEDTMYIMNPHQPVTQTLTLSDYMQIQAEYSNVLPDVSKYIGSVPGDPDSYPKNSNDLPKDALDKIAKDDQGSKIMYDPGDNWVGVSYNSGKSTQSFSTNTTTSSKKDNYLYGAWAGLDIGGQYGNDVFKIKGGIHVSASTLAGATYSSSEGTTFSGSVGNMPRTVKDYGYYFAWKLFEYSIDEGDYTFPVVTYMVADVEAPPELPDNITQDFDNTTSSQTALKWTYSGNVEAFDVYRYYDFPQGGGDILIGTVKGSDYSIRPGGNGEPVLNSGGTAIHEYTFIDDDLTPDTKYQYRIKVRRSRFPQESAFSPAIEARTNVSQMPDVSLTSNDLNIYPDGIFRVAAVLADPENYEKEINYQWQKYNNAKHSWDDIGGCTEKAIAFYKCTRYDEGSYRCRLNVVRKTESNPQYISVYTDPCSVTYSKRSVKFGEISVFDGDGKAPTNTGVSVQLSNASASSTEKPSGMVQFTLEGPVATFAARVRIDEDTGIARINSIEEGLGTLDQADFVNGGYRVTATYLGSAIFYAADDPEDYHYLRNIDETLWLSVSDSYVFGEDIMDTLRLYDYKKGADGKVTRTDETDRLNKIEFYEVDGSGAPTGDAVMSYNLTDDSRSAEVPLSDKLAKKAYVSAYTADSDHPAGSALISTEKMVTTLTLKDRMTGCTQDLFKPYGKDDVVLSGDGDLDKKNIITGGLHRSLSDILYFGYYEQNGDRVNTDNVPPDQLYKLFMPAEYSVGILCPDPIGTFYKMTLEPAEMTVVSNYYDVEAECMDANAGTISMVSPDRQSQYEMTGYAGGTKLIFKAVPDRGFEVKGWTIDECGEKVINLPASDTITYKVRNEKTSGTGIIKITAVLEPKANTLVYKAIGEGTLSASPAIASGSTVVADTVIEFTATPQDGWNFREWRWTNAGGSNSISTGTANKDGSNTKSFRMTDNAAALYAVFMRETIYLDLSGDIEALYINENGANPLEEEGAEVKTDSGRDVPAGAMVILKAKKGYRLDPQGEWRVTVTTPDGTSEAETEEFIYDGCDACRFRLPDNVTACEAGADTIRAGCSIEASADQGDIRVTVDGKEIKPGSGGVYTDITAGSSVEITSLPDRGYVNTAWTVNGKKTESSETVYSTVITGNLLVAVETDADEKYGLTLKADGGEAECVITDRYGRKSDPIVFGDKEVTENLYEGDSVTVKAADEEQKHTLTSVTVNGAIRDLTDGSFTLTDIPGSADDSGNISIACGFMPSEYLTAEFVDETRGWDTVIMDENGLPLNKGDNIEIPAGNTLKFSVVLEKDSVCNVYDGEEYVESTGNEPYGDNAVKFDYEIQNVEENKSLVIKNYDTIEIGYEKQLMDFFDTLKHSPDGYKAPDAVLTADLSMSYVRLFFPLDESYDYGGVFNGNGHTISDISIGSDSSYTVKEDAFYGLFPALSGTVKDLNLVNFNVYTESDPDHGKALVTNTNMGTISGVRINSCGLHTTYREDPENTLAGIAAVNKGTIENCMVDGLTLGIKTDGDKPKTDSAGFAGVLTSDQGSAVRTSWFKDLKTGMEGDLKPAGDAIVAPAEGQQGEFSSNYFKSVFEANDTHGINAYRVTDAYSKDPSDKEGAEAEAETADFARKLSYTINQKCGDGIWGVTSDNDKEFIQVVNGAGGCAAPVKASFTYGGKSVVYHWYPQERKLPGSDTFDPAPALWECDGVAYPKDAQIDITEDMEFTGIDSADDMAACVTDSDGTKEYFADLDKALDRAEDAEAGSVKAIDIRGKCELKGRIFTIDTSMAVTLCSGAVLIISDDAQIVNKGTFTCEAGSCLQKYGSIQNKKGAVIEIGDDNVFFNYGSKLMNKGEIRGSDRIVCKPHCMDIWKQDAKPQADGTWIKRAVCEVCGKTASDTVHPDPDPSEIEDIDILTLPDKTSYILGEKFTSEGLSIMAVLHNGDKAVVTKKGYTLSMEEGTVLDTEGTQIISVKPADSKKNCSCSFEITVSDRSKKTYSIQDAKVVLSSAKFRYRGRTQKPSIKTIGGKSLKEGRDYTIKWQSGSSKNVGTYSLTVTGKGSYTGTTKASYKIVPTGSKIRRLQKLKKGVRVKWRKNSKKMSSSRISGYQIQLATDKKFTKNRKTVRVKVYKKTSVKVSKLKSGRKYYVRIRTYKTVNGKKYYSAWSKVRTVRTRKK